MTKKHLVYTIGMRCASGKFCGFRGPKHPNGLKLCKFPHHLEIAVPGRVYDKVFDTTKPEMYLGPPKGQESDKKDEQVQSSKD